VDGSFDCGTRRKVGTSIWQKNGDLVVDERSWPVFLALAESAGIDVLEDE
jgi:hypothetical protein